MRCSCLIPLLLFFTAIRLQAQTHFISSFSPTIGPVGTTVTINGGGFNPVADSNSVFLGHLKAHIVNASATSLTITVPLKATYNLIRVVSNGPVVATSNKYSAVSNVPFDVTFEDDGILAPNAFNIESIVYDTAYNFSSSASTYVGDFDGDEKLDFATNRAKFRNISQDTPAFARPFYTPSTFPGPPPNTNLYESVSYYTGCTDLSDDGLPDLLAPVSNNSLGYSYTKSFRSIEGHFDSVRAISVGTFIGNTSFYDFNNDGRKDLVYTGEGGLYVKVNDVERLHDNKPVFYSYFCADLDGDGYKDIVAGYNYNVQYEDASGLEFFKNNFATTPGFIDRGNVSDIRFNDLEFYKPKSINGGDFNGDGKIDLLIGITGRGTYLLINSGTPGTISFLPSVLVSGLPDNFFDINDMDGDGKPDIFGTEYVSGTGYVNYIYKNTSTGSNYSFAAGVVYPQGRMGDFDGDGKQDFLVLKGNRRSVFRHNPVSNRTLCPGANISFSTAVTGTAFQWQLNTGNGFANISNDVNYSGVNNASLQISNIPSSFYGYQYRCLVDNNPSGQFAITFKNQWLGTNSSAWEDAANWSCNVLPDANTDVIISSGMVVVNANTSIRSLTVSPAANFTVAPGVVLTITH